LRWLALERRVDAVWGQLSQTLGRKPHLWLTAVTGFPVDGALARLVASLEKIRKVIAEEIPAKVSADKAYQNAMRNSDRQNARIEHDRALERVLIELLKDHTELFKP
jgi:hypothetical protein